MMNFSTVLALSSRIQSVKILSMEMMMILMMAQTILVITQAVHQEVAVMESARPLLLLIP